MHFYGRIWTAVCLFLMLCVPLFIGLYFKAVPSLNGVLMGSFGVCLIFLPSSIVEVITYAPMMGTGATYLAFVTGNLSNLKIPCCMNARDIAGTEYGTRENEIVSTLSVAASALVTCVVLMVGVLALTPLTPILSDPALKPAFDNVVPALFGALGYKYFSQAPKNRPGSLYRHGGALPAGSPGGGQRGDSGSRFRADLHRGGAAALQEEYALR